MRVCPWPHATMRLLKSYARMPRKSLKNPQKGIEMITFMVTLSLLVAAQDGAASVEIFASKRFYKESKGPEIEFVGVLKKPPLLDGGIGFGRVNPFRLETDSEVLEVYAGPQGKLFDPFVGKEIRLVGKAVDMEVEGRQHREIWTATFTIVGGGEEAGEVRIHASTSARIASGTVIRSAAQLAKLTNSTEDKASAKAARSLKVDSIDWTKQMLIVISGGMQRTGGYSVEARSLKVKADKLIVHWKLNKPDPGAMVTQAFTNPTLSILVDRFDGDVVLSPRPPVTDRLFDPKVPPTGKLKK